MRAKYPSDSSVVCVEVSTQPNDHIQESEIYSNLNNEMKEEIRRYMAQPNKPTAKMILIGLQVIIFKGLLWKRWFNPLPHSILTSLLSKNDSFIQD
jgi:hypothetical protein